ncbi:ABC transporter permease [Amnibacterium setariae]|uniref:ABC transporter permease n=1 Tax=Amnibacterium setariae TaxID=2306585 RepID=A0A3A1U130_9MICO|nr:ABC transporter permease [Amnibacterium setariae]RIX28156.1 ABC transporter permease [Amnibacterium setariae]
MLGLVLRGLRWRAALSVTVWVCAVVVCAGAALGPVFALAAAESGLQDVLRDAGAATSVRLMGSTGQETGGATRVTMPEADERFDAAARLLPLAHRPRAVRSLLVIANGDAGPQVMHSRLVWRDGVCAQVRLVAGRCPTGADEAMVSERAASYRDVGWKPGARLTMTATDGTAAVVRIVGVYRPISTASPAWSGQIFFQSGIDSYGTPFTDAVFTTRAVFESLPKDALVEQAVDLPLDAASVRLADLPALRAQVAALRPAARDVGLNASTELAGVLRRADAVHARIDVATALVVLQLCVLGWLVLHRVLVDAVEARSADIALAKLRGFGRGALVRFGLGEPIALLLLAVPAGAAVAFAAATALTRAALLPGTPVVFPWQAWLALAAAVAGGVAAVVQSAWTALRRPVLEQWRRTRSAPRGSRAGLLADAAVAVLAVAAFVVLRLVGPAAGPLTLLGPGLLVAAAGFTGARLLPLVLRPAVPATVASRRIPLFLAVRQVVRRPAGLRLVALLTVATGLAVFGVGGQAVAADNRQARAAAEVGATRVERLQVAPGEDVLGKVAAADPAGRWAAAAATWLPSGGQDVLGTVIAVDARRLAAAEAPAAGVVPPARLAALTRTGTVDPLVVRGRTLVLRATVSGTTGGPLPHVVLEVRAPGGRPVEVPSSSLRTGTHDYRATIPCADGCSLTGIGLSRSVYAEGVVAGTAVLHGIEVDGRAVDAGFRDRRGWHAAVPQGTASDRLRVTSDGLEDRFRSDDGGTGGITQGDVVDPVPAVVAGDGARRTGVGDALTVASVDGATTRLRVQSDTGVLPVVLDDGVLVDLRSFSAALPGFGFDAVWSVWLGPHAPPDALQRLQRAGLVLDGGTTLADRRAELSREGPALALLLLAVCAVAGALLAMGGTAVSIGAAVRRRSYEAAALGTVGIRRRQLYGAALVEQLLLLGSAVVVGVPAGILALVLALPAVPQSNEASPVPLALLPSPAPIVLCAAVLVLLVGATVLVSASRVVRAASSSRLREAEE